MQQMSSGVPAAAARAIVARLYQQTLLSMIEDLEKRKPEAIEWFVNDLENVGLVATAAGFRAESVYRAISFPLIEPLLEEMLFVCIVSGYGFRLRTPILFGGFLPLESPIWRSALKGVLKTIAGVRKALAEAS